MSAKRMKISQGSVFLVTLQDTGFAAGVMARTTRSALCLGYFFGTRIANAGGVDISELQPSDAVLVSMFGDPYLIEGKWPVIGKIEPWIPDEWPVPQMSRVDQSAGRAWLSTYDEGLSFVEEEEITPKKAKLYPDDGTLGCGAVEIVLTKLLNQS